MKKYIFIAVAGILALSACSKIDDTQNAPRQMTFTAGYNEGAQTRATMDFSTKKVSFDANDEISILSANNTNTKFTTSAGGASADFSGTAVNDEKFYATTTGASLQFHNLCTIREIKSARDAIKSREDNVLNYFLERSTNASAESLNSKMKGFRAQLRGVSDLPFFMFRLCRIFG